MQIWFQTRPLVNENSCTQADQIRTKNNVPYDRGGGGGGGTLL